LKNAITKGGESKISFGEFLLKLELFVVILEPFAMTLERQCWKVDSELEAAALENFFWMLLALR
jgi:hypothetical protein